MIFFKKNSKSSTIGTVLSEVTRLEAAGEFSSAADLLISLLPGIANRSAAESYLDSLLRSAGRVRVAEYRQLPQPEILPQFKILSFAALALLLPLLLLIFYSALFLLNWSDFVEQAGGIDALRGAYEQAKTAGNGRKKAEFQRDKDQVAAEKILSEAFRKRFNRSVPAKEHYIMEDSYFDRYPDAYYAENSDKNFIRLNKNLSFMTISDFEKQLPQFQKRIGQQIHPLNRYRFYLDIAYNYALFDANDKCQNYLNLALKQPLPEDDKRDAYFLQATMFYQHKEYKKAAAVLDKCAESLFFDAEMLSILTDFQLVDRQSLAAYLDLDERIIKAVNRLDGDLYNLQNFYNEFEKVRRESSDPMILFFAAEILYGMGNLKKAKTYFEEFYKSEKRVNFSSFKKVSAEISWKIK